MKRVTVIYDGAQYSVSGDDYEPLKAAIEEAASSGRPRWVRVNQGEGRPAIAELLVGPGTSIALLTVRSDEE